MLRFIVFFLSNPWKPMTDKERIEKLLETLLRIRNALTIIQETPGDQGVEADIETLKKTIDYVISQNADQIKLDL